MGRVEDAIIIYESTYTDSAAVYLGGLTRLVKVNDLLRWNTEEGKSLTLAEIARQLPSGQIITVIVNAPLHGEIYQYGNYPDEKWYLIGTTQGYE